MRALLLLIFATVSTAFFHTISGVDHYLPFIVMNKANKWSMKKTLGIVFFCGVGHVIGSILLGIIGIWVSINVSKLAIVEEYRGNLAAILLIIFGILYCLYGLWNIRKNKPHTHINKDGTEEVHSHGHHHHHHGLTEEKLKKSNSIWILFAIFAIGPCEPLIPILMYPEVSSNAFWIFSIIFSFTFVTIGMMVLMTYIGLKGISYIKFAPLEKYAQVIAGFAIFLCGMGIQFLGL